MALRRKRCELDGEETKVKIYEYGNSSAANILIQPVDEHDLSLIENEINEIKRLSNEDFCLVSVMISNWNHELSPWRAPAVFGKEDFGDGADNTLAEIKRLCMYDDKKYIIGGYSLAALFSLWAASQIDIFSGVAAASPSAWFPDFTDYLKNNEIMSNRVYLSIGDKEKNTKNPVMATVEDRIREIYEHLKSVGINAILELNQGNHFKDSDIRTAKAFAWILNGLA